MRAPRGDITFIRENVPLHLIDLQMNLEAVAVRLRASKIITVCNLYITPEEVIAVRQLENLVKQLPKHFIIVGDFNARHPLWGDYERNTHGRIIEDLLNITMYN